MSTTVVESSAITRGEGEEPWFMRVVRAHEFGVLIATALIFLYCTFFVSNFFTSENLLGVAQQITFIGIIGVGMTLLIVAGEIDLSVGSQYGLLSVMMAYTFNEWHLPIVVSSVLVIGLGAVIGLINGLITTFFKVPSFVVTLAMMSILRGFALLRTGGIPIEGPASSTFHSIVGGNITGSLAAQTIWMFAIMGFFGWMLARTRFGSDIYATGGNVKAAQNAGIRTVRVKLICFALTGALCGLSGVILVGWLGSANPLTGNGMELSVIAAVVVGGASLVGGVGSIVGTLCGALVAGLINNALVLLGVDGNWQQVAIGVLILAAVLINQMVSTRQANLR